jgi:regulatory protein YycI of two-component signal transduction system YycFG
MNFKRIQIIFLIIFIMMDGFLYLSFNRSSVGNSDSSSNNILEEMRKDQISFTKPSTDTHEGYYFSGENGTTLRDGAAALQQQTYRFNGQELVSEFKRTIKLPEGEAKATLDKIVANPLLVINGKDYTYSSKLSRDNELIYVQRVAGGPVYSRYGQLRFALNNQHRVIGYSQTYLDNVKLLKEKSKTISEERALTWLYQYNEVPNGAKISWSNLAYTRLLTARGQYVFLPTWVFAVKINNSSAVVLKRVNAYTGEILKTGNGSNNSNANTEIFTMT